jgi:hypothetical protein
MEEKLMIIVRSISVQKIAAIGLSLFLVLGSLNSSSLVYAQSPFASANAGTTGTTSPSFSSGDQSYLQSVYQDTWKYMADFVEPTTGLPYDSNKKQPATSISNVGLYLGSVAIAYRTNLIDAGEATKRIEAALGSLEKIERWEGFPRVWVTARGLKPIHGTEVFSYSKHVANLIAGLVLVQTTFPDQFQYRIGNYMRGMRFRGMYDESTGWLKGGYDVNAKNYAVSQPFGPWHYKFLASEARLISFYMIARGLAPKSHWDSLLRPVQRQNDEWFFVDGYETGGAYMPYMASLYIDERPTLMGVSQKNYTQSQMNLAKKIGAPVWGWSASFDTRGEYVPYGQLKDEVVTPYASILAINHFPQEVISNLQTLEKMGARYEEAIQSETVLPVIFTEDNGQLKTWAAAKDNEVIFRDKNNQSQKLSPYLDNTKKDIPTWSDDNGPLTQLVRAAGYRVPNSETVNNLIEYITTGTLVKKELLDQLSNPKELDQLLGLAAKANLYFPGEIKFKDGTTLNVAFIRENGKARPWAVTSVNDVFFLNENGAVRKFSNYLSKDDSNQIITDRYDRESLSQILSDLGYDTSLESIENFIKEFKTGSILGANLPAIVSTSSDGQDNLSFVERKKEYHLTDVKLTDTTHAKGVFTETEVYTPWALGRGQEISFLDKDANIQKLLPYFIKTISEAQPISEISFSRSSVENILSPLGYKPEDKQSIDQFIKTIKFGTLFNSNLIEQFSDPVQTVKILGLASHLDLFEVGQIELTDGSKHNVLFMLDRGDVKAYEYIEDNDSFYKAAGGLAENIGGFINALQSQRIIGDYEKSPLQLLQQDTQVLSEISEIRILSDLSDDRPATQVIIPTQAGELLSLGEQNGSYSPSEVKLNNGKTMAYGFRDSIDWKSGKVAPFYLTPSQGMAFLSLANALYDGIVWKSFAEGHKISQGLSLLVDASQEAQRIDQQVDHKLCSNDSFILA